LLLKQGSKSRGFSIVEVLVVSLIAGLALGLVVEICKPMLAAQNSEEAALAEIQIMDATLYRMQSDLRQSDPNGIFVCSNAALGIACAQASDFTTPADATYLAILTAKDSGSGATLWDATGRPEWTGFVVYWLVPNGTGTYTLNRGFAPAVIALGTRPTILNADVVSAVTRAIADPAAVLVSGDVERMQTMVDVTRDRVALRIASLSTVGNATNELSVQGDAYARN
jgi:type II secretory pathway pseudopilin PulG